MRSCQSSCWSEYRAAANEIIIPSKGQLIWMCFDGGFISAHDFIFVVSKILIGIKYWDGCVDLKIIIFN